MDPCVESVSLGLEEEERVFVKRKIKMITKIRIENVKGYDVPGREIHLQLDPNRVNLCVAPNGFGKSSLAAAFESLNRNRLDVPEDKKHKDHRQDDSSLVVTIDGNDYEANGNKNEIHSQLSAYVIHNRTQVDYVKRHFRRAIAVSAFMEISQIEVCPVVKEAKTDFYSINSIKSTFGTNRKVLSSIESYLTDVHFCFLLYKIYPVLTKFEAKTRKSLISGVLGKINSISGNEKQVRAAISDGVFSSLEAEPEYVEYLRIYKDILAGKSKFEAFNIFFQLCYLWEHNRADLRKLNERATYEASRRRIDMNLQMLDSTGRNIRTQEKDSYLVVEFPHADEISNGQRDVLTFATELILFKSMVRPDKKYILVIDEVFDYLDDANTMAAQYYLSNIVGRNSGNIYIMLLTHLNPFTFRNYVFNPKMINEQYLEDVVPVANEDMMRFIAFREWLDPKRNPAKQGIYDNLSCDIFHYNPNAVDRSAEIAAYNRPGVKSTWGNPEVFRQVIVDELNKYLSGANNYDPYAVSIALRLRVEKFVYETLQTEELRQSFVDTHTTRKKLKFCEEHNIAVPDAFFIVNSIHNEADHLKQNPLTGKFEERAMVYKLQNGVIRSFVSKLFCYVGVAVARDAIS